MTARPRWILLEEPRLVREHDCLDAVPAAAILIDATIVRAVLLPATMKLLGDRNWYLPAWLEWLPPLEPREAETALETEPLPTSA